MFQEIVKNKNDFNHILFLDFCSSKWFKKHLKPALLSTANKKMCIKFMRFFFMLEKIIFNIV